MRDQYKSMGGVELVGDPSQWAVVTMSSSRNSKRGISSYSSEVLDDVNKRVKDV